MSLYSSNLAGQWINFIGLGEGEMSSVEGKLNHAGYTLGSNANHYEDVINAVKTLMYSGYLDIKDALVINDKVLEDIRQEVIPLKYTIEVGGLI